MYSSSNQDSYFSVGGEFAAVDNVFCYLIQREERKSFDARMQQGLQELAAFRASAAGVEADLEAALALKNAEIEELSSTLDNFRRQAAVAEGKLAALQVQDT